jgi:hypothetical protein
METEFKVGDRVKCLTGVNGRGVYGIIFGSGLYTDEYKVLIEGGGCINMHTGNLEKIPEEVKVVAAVVAKPSAQMELF